MSHFLLLRLVSFLVILTMASLAGTRTTPRVVRFNSANEKEDGRVIHGNASSAIGNWPFIASIGWYDPNGTYNHMCGGTLWDEETILTAAHCLLDWEGHVMDMAWRLHVAISSPYLKYIAPEYVVPVKSVTPHPNFSSLTYFNDIGIVTLREKLDLKGNHSSANCICDPEPIAELNHTACIIMGWGITNLTIAALPREQRKGQAVLAPELMEAEVSILPDAYCDFYSDSYAWVKKICAGKDGKGGRRSCFGDSGGPLVCPYRLKPYLYSQVGIISHGYDDICFEGPTYLTRISSFVDWIEGAARNASSTTIDPAAHLPLQSLFRHVLVGVFGLAGAVAVGVLIGLTIRLGTGKDNETTEETKKRTPASPNFGVRSHSCLLLHWFLLLNRVESLPVLHQNNPIKMASFF